jgi:hypothetical protein
MISLEAIAPHNQESCILDTDIMTAWGFIKDLNFAKMFPHSVKKCSLLGESFYFLILIIFLVPISQLSVSADVEKCAGGPSAKHIGHGDLEYTAIQMPAAPECAPYTGNQLFRTMIVCGFLDLSSCFVCPSSIGSLRLVEYNDGAQFTFRWVKCHIYDFY